MEEKSWNRKMEESKVEMAKGGIEQRGKPRRKSSDERRGKIRSEEE